MAERSDVHEGTEASGGGGLPQFETKWWGGEAIWLLIVFAIVFTLISKVFAPKLRHAINERSSKISEDLANARALRDEADAQHKAAQAEIVVARNAAHKTAAEAKAKAAAAAALRQAEEDAKLSAHLEGAQARIAEARDQALSHVNTIAAETASALVEKLSGVAADAKTIESALGAVASHS